MTSGYVLLKSAVGLGVAAPVCFLLVGGVGPCGPGTPFGLVLLLAGFALGLAAWGSSIAALVLVLVAGPRESLFTPALLGLPISAVIGAALTFYDGAAGLLAFWICPVLVATGVLINQQRRRFRHSVNS